MSDLRKSRGPVRQSVRERPPLHRGQSWKDMEDMTPPRKRNTLKHYCRSVTAFMCTQVGVGGIIVCYAVVGASVFIALESQVDKPFADEVVRDVTISRNFTALNLWKNYQSFQFNHTEWELAANATLNQFQRTVVLAVKKGYDRRSAGQQWNFPAALMYTLSIFTMIGFGNLVPRTDWGKVVTMLYAVLGIPLYILYFMNMGKALASMFRWLYIKLNSCSVGIGSSDDVSTHSSIRPKVQGEHIIVPSTASIYVLICYILIGTVMFSNWERWEYLDSVYFCVTSLCKIGYGDFVPGTDLDETEAGNQTKLVINFIYLLVGLGLVAMCYNLLREEVVAKLQQIKGDLRDLCSLVRNECTCRKGEK